MNMDTQHGHEAWALACSVDMDMQHGHGHAAWTWKCSMDMTVLGLQAFHGTFPFTFTRSPALRPPMVVALAFSSVLILSDI
jgi:hypothetical protein